VPVCLCVCLSVCLSVSGTVASDATLSSALQTALAEDARAANVLAAMCASAASALRVLVYASAGMAAMAGATDPHRPTPADPHPQADPRRPTGPPATPLSPASLSPAPLSPALHSPAPPHPQHTQTHLPPKPPGKLMYIAGSCNVPIYISARYIAIFPYVHSRSSGRWARPQVRASCAARPSSPPSTRCAREELDEINVFVNVFDKVAPANREARRGRGRLRQGRARGA
jgi:hypothetical protein